MTDLELFIEYMQGRLDPRDLPPAPDEGYNESQPALPPELSDLEVNRITARIIAEALKRDKAKKKVEPKVGSQPKYGPLSQGEGSR